MIGLDNRYRLDPDNVVRMKEEYEPTQANDGQAHLAYFDVRTQASFVWDGMSDEIQVCIGGYGEPVDHTISAAVAANNRGDVMVLEDGFHPNPSQVNLNWFAVVCAAHAKTLPNYEDRA